MALNRISKTDGCTNSKSIALYPTFSDIPSSFFWFCLHLFVYGSCCFDCNTKIFWALECLMTLVMVHNVLHIFLISFFWYFNKREVTILWTFIDCVDLADQALYFSPNGSQRGFLDAVLTHDDLKLPSTWGKEDFLESCKWRAVN